jgi:Uncharacterized small membrane protein
MIINMQDRLLLLLGGLFGVIGVVLASVAAHITGPGQVDVAANIMLFHAPALIAIALVAHAGIGCPKAIRLSGWMVMLGVALFSGDLCMRAFLYERLFPMAAPTGGTILILGWLLFSLMVLMGNKKQS